MKEDDFAELVASIKEAGSIQRGEVGPSRRFEFEPADVKEIRRSLGLSQSGFAMLIGVSVATLQNWEQGRRRPEGPARALLRIAEKNPQAVLEALVEGREAAPSDPELADDLERVNRADRPPSNPWE